MRVRAKHKVFVQCPVCEQHEWRIDQCQGRSTFGPWLCKVCCNYFKFTLRTADTYEVEQIDGPEGRNTPVTVTLVSQTVPPITVKLNTWKWGHSQKDTPEEYREHQRYFYNEHTCPTNWLCEVEEISVPETVCGRLRTDRDPHGLFEFVSVEDGHYKDPTTV
jgi:hypothetical protein